MKLVDEITKLKMDKNSSEISIPGSYLSKKFLSKFKNLKKVKLIGKFTLTQEAIDLFKSCGIKEVEGEFTLDEALKGLEPSWYYIYKTHGYSYFQDIVINEIKEDDESLPYVHIKNAKDIDLFSNYLDLTDISVLNIDLNGINVRVENHNKDIKIIYYGDVTKENIAVIKNILKNYNIKREVYLAGIDDKTTVIKTQDGVRIEIGIKDLNRIPEIIKRFKEKDIDINNIVVHTEMLADIYEADLEKVQILAKKYNVNIVYGHNNIHLAEDLNEFLNYKESIKYFRDLIKDSNFSPVEKLMFAYDIVKTFPYKDNDNDKSEARLPHKILNSDKIVCVGYSYLMEEILSNLDSGLTITNLDVRVNATDKQPFDHQRNMVKIKDDKYNIEGIYLIDTTFDSVKPKDIGPKIGENYEPIDLYMHFLVPVSEYNVFFNGEEYPKIFINNNLTNEEVCYRDNIVTTLLGSNDLKTFYEMLKGSKRPSKKTFLEILKSVRQKEGYSMAELEKYLEKYDDTNHRDYYTGAADFINSRKR